MLLLLEWWCFLHDDSFPWLRTVCIVFGCFCVLLARRVSYLIGLMLIYCTKFCDFFPRETQKIILYAMRFNPHEVKLNTQKLEFLKFLWVPGVRVQHKNPVPLVRPDEYHRFPSFQLAQDCLSWKCYFIKYSILGLFSMINIHCISWKLLPPANEVWGKVIFSEACVILSTGGSAWPGTPLREQTPPEQTPPWDQAHPPGSRHPLPPGAEHARRYSQHAGGTHPTGMQSCFRLIFQNSYCCP